MANFQEMCTNRNKEQKEAFLNTNLFLKKLTKYICTYSNITLVSKL